MVLQETKPMYQKIVEGAVYSHETLAPQSVAEWKLRYGEFHNQDSIRVVDTVVETAVLPVATPVLVEETTTVIPAEVITTSTVLPVASSAAPAIALASNHASMSTEPHHHSSKPTEPHHHHSLRDLLHLRKH